MRERYTHYYTNLACPKCWKHNVITWRACGREQYRCEKCGHRWEASDG